MKTTHIQRVKQKHLKNESFILQKAGVSQYQYNELIFETGLKFLEEFYGEKAEKYQKHFAYDRAFWAWFMLEWKEYEQVMLNFWYENKTIPTVNDWKANMQQMALDDVVNERFYHFITKIYKNVRL